MTTYSASRRLWRRRAIRIVYGIGNLYQKIMHSEMIFPIIFTTTFVTMILGSIFVTVVGNQQATLENIVKARAESPCMSDTLRRTAEHLDHPLTNRDIDITRNKCDDWDAKQAQKSAFK